MKLVTVSQMQAVEKEADSNGLTYDQMMENAGQGLADVVLDLFIDEIEPEAVGLVEGGSHLATAIPFGTQARNDLALRVREATAVRL